MKKHKLIIAILFFSILLQPFPLITQAKESSISIEQIEEYLENQLNTLAKESDISIKFNNVELTPRTNDDSSKLLEDVNSFLEQLKKNIALQKRDDNFNVPKTSSFESYAYRATSNSKTYTASVNCAVPAIGWGYINQDFNATVSNSRISSAYLLGSSSLTGATLCRWTPNYSWLEISKNRQFIQINMKGTLHYFWKAVNISTDATFLSTKKAQGNTLVDAIYSDFPD